MNGGLLPKLKYYVLTVKDYLPYPEQLKIEEEFISYINEIWNKYKFRCVFIPTGANPIEENDLPVGKRIEKAIDIKKIFTIEIPKTPESTKRIIANAEFAICTRMHSAIFAITEFTPFIAIAYEHKSIGLLQSMGLNEWYLNMRDVRSKKLIQMTTKLLKNQTHFINQLNDKRSQILEQRQELKKQLLTI